MSPRAKHAHFSNLLYLFAFIFTLIVLNVVGWSGSSLARGDNTTQKILPINQLLTDLNLSKNFTEKEAQVPSNISFLLLPFLCALLSTVGHCFSKSKKKRHFDSKHKYLILKTFRPRSLPKITFILPKLMLVCAFLVSHLMDKNANLELNNLKKNRKS